MGGEGEQVLEGISVTQYKEPAVGVACSGCGLPEGVQ